MRPYRIGLRKYEYSLLDLCEQVHMASNGSGDDPLCGLEAAVEELRNRLNNWQWTESHYDLAVREMVSSSYNEGFKELERRKKFEEKAS